MLLIFPLDPQWFFFASPHALNGTWIARQSTYGAKKMQAKTLASTKFQEIA